MFWRAAGTMMLPEGGEGKTRKKRVKGEDEQVRSARSFNYTCSKKLMKFIYSNYNLNKINRKNINIYNALLMRNFVVYGSEGM